MSVLHERVAQLIRGLKPRRALIAYSGGADSTALLHSALHRPLHRSGAGGVLTVGAAGDSLIRLTEPASLTVEVACGAQLRIRVFLEGVLE